MWAQIRIQRPQITKQPAQLGMQQIFVDQWYLLLLLSFMQYSHRCAFTNAV